MHLDFQFNKGWQKIKTVEMHTGGEPLRITIEGLPKNPGKDILEKRRFFRDNFDHLRTALMFEPRGHADMYGAILTEPISQDADFGTYFIHNEGYSTMCGHAIIALTKFALDTGYVQKEGDHPELIIDAPPGKIVATGHRVNGIVEKTSFLNVPSFLLYRDENIEVEGIGKITFDVAYGGAFYAFVDASEMDIELTEKDYNKLIDWGRKIKTAVAQHYEIKHPFEKDLSFLYGTIFTDKPHNKNHHSRNVCVFAEGEVDRSSTGSGVSARAALHYAKGELELKKPITIESILGTTMTVEATAETTFGEHKAVIPKVTGTAHFTGTNEFWIDPKDPLQKGFIFR
jgi:trans-L-3-hydroxyproline dehydratase